MFRILARSARTGIVTDPQPLAPRLQRGFPVIDFRRCTACGDCARACPTGAIQVGAADPASPGPHRDDAARCPWPTGSASPAASASPPAPREP